MVENHALLFRDALGEPWSRPAAYRWLRYEDPDPLARLLEGTRRLEARWESLDAGPGSAAARAVATAAAHEGRHLEELFAAARELRPDA